MTGSGRPRPAGESDAPDAPPAGPVSGVAALVVSGAMLSDPGRVRQGNEDRVAWSTRQDKAGRFEGAIAVVADGMGGHAAGEVASGIAAEVVVRSFWDRPGTAAERLRACVLDAHEAVRAAAADNPALAGMGTTCTAMAFEGGRAYLVHVGDSRAYLLREGAFRQLSEDQTYVAQLVRDGALAPENAKDHPQAHVILQALGSARTVTPQEDAGGLEMHPGDLFLLCSDGLTNMVDDRRIRDICGDLDAGSACGALIAEANRAGGPDNISVGIFTVANAEQTGAHTTTRRLPAFGTIPPPCGKAETAPEATATKAGSRP